MTTKLDPVPCLKERRPGPVAQADTDNKKAERHLKRADPRLAAVIKRVGPCQMRHEGDPWRALASSIIGQQISVYAARAIRGRFAAIQAGQEFPAPGYVLERDDDQLRAVGLSANKCRSLKDLALHFVDGKITPDLFQQMEDEAIIAELLPVRGIGRWTAEMFLLFSLGRPDVLAVDDLGLRNAMRNLYELEAPPAPAAMREIAEPWRPYRSVASWYLWRSLDNEPKVS